jgi:predicted dehydrogenase
MALKAGYIGTGGISGKHLRAMAEMKDKVEIAALCDVNEDAAKARAEEYGGKVYTDYRKMLDDEDLDIAFICVPPDSHGDIEVRCAEKGLHMLVEKPVNLYLEDAIKANEAIKKADVVTSVGYLAGYNNIDRAIKKFLADKTIGMIVSERWGGVPGNENHWWRVMYRSGGMLHEQATHQLNTMRYYAGDVVEVYKRDALRINVDLPNHTVPDCEIVTLVFKSGGIGYITTTCAMINGGGWGRMDIVVEGHMRLQPARDGVKVLPEGAAEIEVEDKPVLNLDQSFIEAIITGDRSLITDNYENGLKTAAITIAANESAKLNKPVKVYQP